MSARTSTTTASTASSTAVSGQATGLPTWMPGGRVEAEHEPVFSQLVHELDLATPGVGSA